MKPLPIQLTVLIQILSSALSDSEARILTAFHESFHLGSHCRRTSQGRYLKLSSRNRITVFLLNVSQEALHSSQCHNNGGDDNPKYSKLTKIFTFQIRKPNVECGFDGFCGLTSEYGPRRSSRKSTSATKQVRNDIECALARQLDGELELFAKLLSSLITKRVQKKAPTVKSIRIECFTS